MSQQFNILKSYKIEAEDSQIHFFFLLESRQTARLLSPYFLDGFWGVRHAVHVLILLNLSQQIPVSVKGVFQPACFRSQPTWKRRLDNTTRSKQTVALEQIKNKGQ